MVLKFVISINAKCLDCTPLEAIGHQQTNRQTHMHQNLLSQLAMISAVGISCSYSFAIRGAQYMNRVYSTTSDGGNSSNQNTLTFFKV